MKRKLPLLRRQFITLLGSAAAGWPLVAQARRPGKLPTVGILGPDPPAFQNQLNAAFVRRLSELGWVEGRTVTITPHSRKDAPNAILVRRTRPAQG